MMTLRIAVVGAGRMGTALAFELASAGHTLRLMDSSADARARVPAELARIARLVGRGVPQVEILGDLDAAADGCALIIETAVEDAAIKRSIIRAVSRRAPDAVLTTNTSALPLRELATAAERPERFLGTHFWNPPYAVKLVEVVRHETTSEAAMQTAVEALRVAGFVPVRVAYDIPGLIGNRLQHALKREAIALVAAGVCDAETVDTVAKMTIGRRLEVLGPLEQSDLVGLDLTLAIHRTLLPDLDRTDHAQPYLENLVSQKNLGMKSGRGFRSWTPAEAQATRDRLDRHLLCGLQRGASVAGDEQRRTNEGR